MGDDRFRAPEGSAEYEELFDAANDGDIERLKAALLPSMNVDALEADRLHGRAALHVAAQSENVTAIQFLLAHGAKVDLRNSEGETPLHEAAYWARPEAAKALLDAGADINLPTGDYSYTALHNVLKHKHSVTPPQIQTIELLLDRGLDPNAKADSWGSTLIDQACALHSIELAQILIAKGARLGNALLCASDDNSMAKFLLSQGAKIVSAPGQTSAITNAAGVGNIDVVRSLISHASNDELDKSRDALHWAAAGGCKDVVELLIEHGFDVNTTIKGCMVGETPLLATCEFRELTLERLAVTNLLIQKGADVNAHSQDGRTAAELLLHSDSSGLFRFKHLSTELKQIAGQIQGSPGKLSQAPVSIL